MENIIKHGTFSSSQNATNSIQNPIITKTTPQPSTKPTTVEKKQTSNQDKVSNSKPEQVSTPPVSSRFQAIISSGATEHYSVFQKKPFARSR